MSRKPNDVQEQALERVRAARTARVKADQEFRDAVVAAVASRATGGLTYREIGDAAGLTSQGVIGLVRRTEAADAAQRP